METDVATKVSLKSELGKLPEVVEDIAERIRSSDVGWEVDLTESEVEFVKDLATIVQTALDEDLLGVQVLDNTDDGARIKAALRHKHECGQRLTGPAVTVEVA
jgi:hypothetical protein